jgi:hypothetical protein
MPTTHPQLAIIWFKYTVTVCKTNRIFNLWDFRLSTLSFGMWCCAVWRTNAKQQVPHKCRFTATAFAASNSRRLSCWYRSQFWILLMSQCATPVRQYSDLLNHKPTYKIQIV